MSREASSGEGGQGQPLMTLAPDPEDASRTSVEVCRGEEISCFTIDITARELLARLRRLMDELGGEE